MNGQTASFYEELKKLRRTADMLCTAHAIERDRYCRRGKLLDLLLIAASTYLVAMAFVDPALSDVLTPFDWTPIVWVGTLSLVIFALSIMQLVVDWKGRADAHGRSFCMYAEAKSRCAEALNGDGLVSQDIYNAIRSRYDMATDVGIAVSEGRFLRLKQRHLVKVQMSKCLDERPAAWLLILRIRMWWNDTFREKNSL